MTTRYLHAPSMLAETPDLSSVVGTSFFHDNSVLSLQVRVVILADHPLEDLFPHDGDFSHDESHILMDDLGLKRVRTPKPLSDVSYS